MAGAEARWPGTSLGRLCAPPISLQRNGAPLSSALGVRLNALGAHARRSPRYKWWVLWVSLSGLLATNLLFTVFVVALPQMAHSLHTQFSAITWVVTGPMLAFGVMAPMVGKAGDVFGQRRLFMTGIVSETIAATLSATAPNVGVLIAARASAGWWAPPSGRRRWRW